MAAARLGAVYAMVPRRACHVTVGSVDTRATKAAPGLEVTVAAGTVSTQEGTVIPVSAIAALGLAPVPDPACVAASALSSDMVTGVSVTAGRAAVATAFTVEAGGTWLVAFGSIPAWLTRQTAALCYSARLLAFALAAPAATAQAIEAGRTRLATVLATVARLAGARAIHWVTAASEALAVTIAACTKRALAALAAATLLLAGRRVAGALIAATAAPPARVAQAGARLRVAARCGAAVACSSTLRAPPAGFAAASAAPRVACAMLALARMLAAFAPALRMARALASHVLTLPMWVADTPLFAVGAPELARAFSVAVGTKVAVAAAALARPHAHFIL